MGPPRGSADPLPRMQEAGYSADRRILDAADHGVPQRRRRTIILAAKAPLAFGWPAPAAGRPYCFQAFALGDEEARASTVGAYNLFMTPEKAAYYQKRMRERPGYTRFVDPDVVCSTLRAGYLKSRGAKALVARDAAGFRCCRALGCPPASPSCSLATTHPAASPRPPARSTRRISALEAAGARGCEPMKLQQWLAPQAGGGGWKGAHKMKHNFQPRFSPPGVWEGHGARAWRCGGPQAASIPYTKNQPGWQRSLFAHSPPPQQQPG